MNMKWIFPGESYTLKASWFGKIPSYGDQLVQKTARKFLPAGVYYTIVAVKAGNEIKRFLVKFEIKDSKG